MIGGTKVNRSMDDLGLKMKQYEGIESPLSVLLKAVSQRSVEASTIGSEQVVEQAQPVEKSKFPFKKNKFFGIPSTGKKDEKTPRASVRPLKKATLSALRSAIADHSRSVQTRRLAACGSCDVKASEEVKRTSLLCSLNQARAILDRNMERTACLSKAVKEEENSCAAVSRPNSGALSVSNEAVVAEWNRQVERMLLRHSERRKQVKLQEMKLIELARQKEHVARASAMAAALGAAAVREAAVEKLLHARQSAQFQSSVEQMIMRHVARRKMGAAQAHPLIQQCGSDHPFGLTLR